MDQRTAGRRGSYEKEGLKESTSAAGSTDSFEIAGMEGNLHLAWGQRGAGDVLVDAPNKNASLHRAYCVNLFVHQQVIKQQHQLR